MAAMPVESVMVRMALWNNLPEVREKLREMEEHESENVDYYEGHEFFIGSYNYISEAFTHRFFFPLLDSDGADGEVLDRCSRAIEQMLSEHDETHDLESPVSIRIVQHLLLQADRWRKFRPFAGPLLTEMVRHDAQYFWHEDDPVLP